MPPKPRHTSPAGTQPDRPAGDDAIAAHEGDADASSWPDVSGAARARAACDSRAEIRATIALREPEGVRANALSPIGQVVMWIAELGGYTGKSSGGPPGLIVIARGLNEIRPVARLIERRSRRTKEM